MMMAPRLGMLLLLLLLSWHPAAVAAAAGDCIDEPVCDVCSCTGTTASPGAVTCSGSALVALPCAAGWAELGELSGHLKIENTAIVELNQTGLFDGVQCNYLCVCALGCSVREEVVLLQGALLSSLGSGPGSAACGPAALWLASPGG